jgi:hypothetical protein
LIERSLPVRSWIWNIDQGTNHDPVDIAPKSDVLEYGTPCLKWLPLHAKAIDNDFIEDRRKDDTTRLLAVS